MLTITNLVGFAAADFVNDTARTWNSADKSANITLSNGDLDATGPASPAASSVRATGGIAGGKWYWETRAIAVGGTIQRIGSGLIISTASLSSAPGVAASGVGFEQGSALLVNGVTRDYATVFPTISTNDHFMHAFDYANGLYWMGINGTWLNSGNPDAGTGYVAHGAAFQSGTWYPAAGCADNGNTMRIVSNYSAFIYNVSRDTFPSYGSL